MKRNKRYFSFPFGQLYSKQQQYELLYSEKWRDIKVIRFHVKFFLGFRRCDAIRLIPRRGGRRGGGGGVVMIVNEN